MSFVWSKSDFEFAVCQRFIGRFFRSVLDLDSQLIRTLKALFVPAKLSIEYFQGRRKSYLNPFRLFFFVAVLSLASLNFIGIQTMEDDLAQNSESFRLDYLEEEMMEKVDSTTILFLERNDYPEAKEGIDSLRKELKLLDNDSFDLRIKIFGQIKNADGVPVQLERRDIFHSTKKHITEKYNITGLFDQILLSQLLKYYKDGGSFARFFSDNLLWLVLIATLVYAWILKLFFRKRRKYYVEHLVYALYDSSAPFLVMTVAILLVRITAGYSMLLMIPTLFFPWFSIKKFYDLSWKQSFIKYNYISFFVLIITLALMFLTFVLSFLLF